MIFVMIGVQILVIGGDFVEDLWRICEGFVVILEGMKKFDGIGR